MTASLFGERFLGVRKPGWHNLGKVVDTDTDPVEGLALIDGDFEITKAPLITEVPTLFGMSRVEIPDRLAIVRQPTDDDLEYAVFGFCSPRYEIIQRRDLATALRRLTDRWPLETIGLLGKGETVFFTLDAGEIEIGGDLVHQYFCVTDTVDGNTTQRNAFTPVRVVCQNTLDAGMRAAVANSALTHTKEVRNNFEFRLELIDNMMKTQNTIISSLDKMTKVALKVEQLQAILNATYPYPKRKETALKMEDFAVVDTGQPWLQRLVDGQKQAQYNFNIAEKNAVEMRSSATELFNRFNDEFPQTANTAWAAFNAICELADWREGKGDVDASALFGPRAKEKHRAYAYITSNFIKAEK